MGGSAAADPAAGVLREFQDRLAERLEILLDWVVAGATNRLARLPDCELALTKLPIGYKLTAIFMGADLGEEAAPEPVERGRRVLKYGSCLDLQEHALTLARCGIAGGPTYDDGPVRWALVTHDRSLRTAVPGGELRVNPLLQRASNVAPTADDPYMLMFEDEQRVYPLEIGNAASLRETALATWNIQEARQPLRVLLNGQCVYLRSADVPGVLGYHAVTRRTFIVLAWVDGEIGLYYVDGYRFARLARLTVNDLRHGEAPDVDALLRAQAQRGAANEGPVVFTDVPPDDGPHDHVAEDHASADAPSTTPPPGGPAPRPGAAAMDSWHRELCERHLRRLHATMRGRGARKARELLPLILLCLERCRDDLRGSRTDVHAMLAQVLACTLSGGNRNVRDCLDLLARHSPLFVKDGTDYAILFAQLHDPGSELIRRLGKLETPAVEQASPHAPASTPSAPAPPSTQHDASDPRPVPTTANNLNVPPPPPATEPPRPPREQAATQQGSSASHSPGDTAEVQLYQTLGTPENPAPSPPTPTPAAPPTASTFRQSSLAPLADFVKKPPPRFDDPNDPLDPELESLDSPSRMYLASRQNLRRGGNGGDADGNHDSS